MKRAGVVRRIDDLGRVVIPKEIRKTLRKNKNIYILRNECYNIYEVINTYEIDRKRIFKRIDTSYGNS